MGTTGQGDKEARRLGERETRGQRGEEDKEMRDQRGEGDED
jgi:hypothetical protein